MGRNEDEIAKRTGKRQHRNANYFSTAIYTENPIIDNLIEDSLLFRNANTDIVSDRKTILCSIKQIED